MGGGAKTGDIGKQAGRVEFPAILALVVFFQNEMRNEIVHLPSLVWPIGIQSPPRNDRSRLILSHNPGFTKVERVLAWGCESGGFHPGKEGGITSWRVLRAAESDESVFQRVVLPCQR
jgi:hypothetical protein